MIEASAEISLVNSSNSEQSVNEKENALRDELPVSNRVVIYGSRISGANQIAHDFQGYLEDHELPNPDVHTCRDASRIRDAFYDIPAKIHIPVNTIVSPPISEVRRGLRERLAEKFHGYKKVEPSAVEIPLPATAEEPKNESQSLPMGVVVLPEMRFYTEDGYGNTIEAPFDFIKQLCDKHGVPIVRIEGEAITEQEISDGIIQALQTRQKV